MPKKPQSKAEQERNGSWRAKYNEPSAEPSGVAPQPPETLDVEGRAEWDRVVKFLSANNVLDESMRGALVSYCEVWSETRKLMASRDRHEVGCDAWLSQDRRLLQKRDQIRMFAQSFGITPADRARVKVPNKGAQRKDGKSRFFSTKGREGSPKVAG